MNEKERHFAETIKNRMASELSDETLDHLRHEVDVDVAAALVRGTARGRPAADAHAGGDQAGAGGRVPDGLQEGLVAVDAEEVG